MTSSPSAARAARAAVAAVAAWRDDPAVRFALVLFTAWFVLAVVGSVQFIVGMRAAGVPMHLAPYASTKGIEAAALLLQLPLVVLVGRRRPLASVGAFRHLLAVLLVLAPLMLLVSATSVDVLQWLAPHFQFKGSRVGKALGDLPIVLVAAVFATVVELQRRLQEQDARLAEARLQALAGQLHPHFLFNTLNAAATLLHRAPDAADGMLTRLAELLRATLRQPPRHEIPLAEELSLLERYVDIMRLRHGPRLSVTIDADPAALDRLVPSFLLQPLVENALEHGVARRSGPARVDVAVRLRDERLELAVEDDGPGITAASAGAGADGGEGIGLSNTVQRLAHLHGPRAALRLERLSPQGTRALVTLPARRAAMPDPTAAPR